MDTLGDDERREAFDAFAPDPDMQPYGRGLRRRSPAMLDTRRMRMVFSLPGTPMLFCGEEIGIAGLVHRRDHRSTQSCCAGPYLPRGRVAHDLDDKGRTEIGVEA